MGSLRDFWNQFEIVFFSALHELVNGEATWPRMIGGCRALGCFVMGDGGSTEQKLGRRIGVGRRGCRGRRSRPRTWLSAGQPPTIVSVSNFQKLPRLDISVRQQVGLEVRALVEASLTNRTSVGTLLHVEDTVDSKCPRLAETFAAFIAFEGLLF